jgi:hypothetical protein
LLEPRDQVGVVGGPFGTVRFDGRQGLADGVDNGEEGGGDRLVEAGFAGPELAEEVFGGVGERLEADEAEEAGGPFDGMERAEGAGERLAAGGVLLEGDQVGVEFGEVFVRFEEEFADDFVHARLGRR